MTAAAFPGRRRSFPPPGTVKWPHFPAPEDRPVRSFRFSPRSRTNPSGRFRCIGQSGRAFRPGEVRTTAGPDGAAWTRGGGGGRAARENLREIPSQVPGKKMYKIITSPGRDGSGSDLAGASGSKNRGRIFKLEQKNPLTLKTAR